MADGKLCYNPDIFRVRNLDEARRIILTNEGPADTGECRRKEMPALAAGLCRELNLRKNQLLLDYGCGVGRLARELCALGCSVIGVDISPEMRTMARDYVGNPKHFLALSPEEFDLLTANGLRCDAAYAVWVLQHCVNPVEDLTRIFSGLRLHAGFHVVNNRELRAVPVTGGSVWLRDNVDIWELTAQFFSLSSTRQFPAGAGIAPHLALCRTYLKTRDHL